MIVLTMRMSQDLYGMYVVFLYFWLETLGYGIVCIICHNSEAIYVASVCILKWGWQNVSLHLDSL